MDLTLKPAHHDDAEQIYQILAPYVDQGIILERTIEDIHQNIETFITAWYSDIMIGVVAYHDYGDSLIEIRSLAVKKDVHQSGAGSALIRELITLLKNNNVKRIFTLTYAPAFFSRFGFQSILKESLPQKIWKDCVTCKNRDNCGEHALLLTL